jgi:winged helix-turn-helix DNA-binding protein
MSDRAIGHVAGLAAKTVAGIRKRSTDHPAQSNTRVGRDGRVRPLDSSEARRRAAELLTSQPGSSLRDVARAVGISPATVLDVRKRLERGESPVPGRPAAGGGNRSGTGAPGNGDTAATGGIPAPGPQAPSIAHGGRSVAPANPTAAVAKLLRDPSLRNNERGKGMLRLLQVNAVSEAELPDTVGAVPPHCVGIVVQLARHYARMWHEFAKELDGRARIIDPSATGR